jgi:Cd2+/Zn2+-exporting ATPase
MRREERLMKYSAEKEPECARCADETPEEEQGQAGKGRLASIIIAFLLFLVGTVFNGALHNTPHSIAEYLVLLSAYFLVGWPVLLAAAKDIAHGRLLNEMFLMSVATIGAIAIHQLPEAAGVMLFYSIGELLQDMAVDKSRKK